ncbi:helix-turn-helix domain-containing protein, partial [Candidatus Saccharibacteria bacterium]|nr:helix-turn-helix domain-containing protein [Candidatus Saccharibacteria bacterium]
MASGIPHDPKIRNEVLNAVKSGMTQMEASRLYGISPNTISTWCRKDVVGGDKNYIAQ